MIRGVLCFSFLLVVIPLSSWAGIGISADPVATNASNVISTGTTPTFYYSNISSATAPALYGSDPFNLWKDNGGAACTTLLNPHCHQSSDAFNVGATDSVATNGNGKFCLVFQGSSPQQPATPASGGASIAINTWAPVGSCWTDPGPGGAMSYSTGISYTTICTAAQATLSGSISPACVQVAPQTVPIQLWIIADANGNGSLDPGESVASLTLTVQSYIPSNADTSSVGMYSWEAFPGDGEVHMKNVSLNEDTNLSTGLQYARFYFVTGPDVYTSFNNPATFTQINATDITPVGAGIAHQDIAIVNNQFGTSYVTGLSNGNSYYFRSALVDNAGNIGYITPQAGDLLPAVPAPLQAHAAKPDQIAGLIAKNWDCFIATAAYGSPLDRHVKTLREFRDKILLKTPRGQRFVHWYYKNSPEWALKIKDRDGVRAVVRTFLYPVVGFSWLSLKIGAYNACLLVVTLLLFPLLFVRVWTSRSWIKDSP